MTRYRYFLLSSVLQFPYSVNVQQYRFFFAPTLPPYIENPAAAHVIDQMYVIDVFVPNSHRLFRNFHGNYFFGIDVLKPAGQSFSNISNCAFPISTDLSTLTVDGAILPVTMFTSCLSDQVDQ